MSIGNADALDRRSDGAKSKTWQDQEWLLGHATAPEQLREWELRIRSFLRGEIGGDWQHGGLRAAKELPRKVGQSVFDGHLAWPTILRRLLPSHRTVTPTYLRPNRRFPTRIGELPGRVQQPNLLVGIDTSASMSSTELGCIRTELLRLQRHANCTIAECDAAVRRVHHSAHIEVVTGGGDTDYEALFDLLDGRPDFDAAIYFTDGAGSWPEASPRVPVLWALTNERAFDCPWGTVVRTAPARQ